MNHIYRLIWSKALKCIVAVSETTKGRGKDNTKSQAVGGSESTSQEIQFSKQAQAPPPPLKLISLRNAISAIAMSTGLLGLYSGEVRANCTIGSNVTCTGNISGSATGLYNSSSIGTLSNSGTISGTLYGVLNSSTGSIQTLNNTVTGSIYGGASGINNAGSITSITNSGTISGVEGINNTGNITTLNNGTYSRSAKSMASISELDNSGTIGFIRNYGTISTISNTRAVTGSNTAIYGYRATITSLLNAGTINGSNTAIYNVSSTISSLRNSGTISSNSSGIQNVFGKDDIAMINSIFNSSSGLITVNNGQAIYNFGDSSVTLATISSIQNEGTISSSGGIAIYNLAVIDEITNSGTIVGSGLFGYGIKNEYGSIGALTNNGLISGSNYGIWSVKSGGVGTQNIPIITNTGTIIGGTVGIYNAQSSEGTSTIGIINNSIGAKIYGSQTGIYNSGSIVSISNSGSIIGSTAGITNTNYIGSISNSGAGATISSLVNSGTIASISNGGSIPTITNSGSITTYSGTLPTNYSILINSTTSFGKIGFSSPTGTMAFGVDSGSTVSAYTYVGVLSGLSSSSYFTGGTTSGTISGGLYTWSLVQESGSWDLIIAAASTGYTFSGNATSYTNSSSIGNVYNAGYTVDTISNTGTISGLATGLYNSGSIGTLANSRTISGTSYGVLNTSAGSIGTLSNTVTGSIYGGATGIKNAGTISLLSNSGTINGATAGINNLGTISTLANATSSAKISKLDNSGTIGSISNLGTISTISNSGSIPTITNIGKISAYSGTLPTNYSILISGTIYGQYGQMTVGSITGMMNFGIATGSTLTTATYSNVLSGFSVSYAPTYLSSTTGTFGNYSWTLTPETSTVTNWDLVVSVSGYPVPTGDSTSTASLASSTLTSVNLSGGTIVGSSSTGTVTQAIAVSSTGSTVDQKNAYTTITGVVSGSSRLTITNTAGTIGAVAVTADNGSFSGGFQVDAGAKLQVGTSSALGTGSIDLIGTATVSATLATTADMTITNPITVANDPTFDVASGTTLTVSSAITNGTVSGTVVAGDVVVTGGGTLDLTAVNTYTGTTTISSGSTLALSGNGSIADSSRLYNYGTFDVTGSNYTAINLNGFTQTASGTLKMNIAPTTAASQTIQVAGSAAIGGNLYVNGSAGSYVGNTKYTIINTTGGLSGTFSGVTTNLANATKFSYDAYSAYLSVLAFSTANTQQSLVNTANALQGTYALQNSVLVNSFSYDCNDFGPEGICISAGGRNTSIPSSGNASTSALLIGSYRATDSVRIGAYFDQNLSASNPGGTVQLANNTPLVGIFGAWAQKRDGTGPEIKVAAAYGQKNTTITRQVVGNTEPGSGSSTLYSSGAQLSAKYGFAVTENTNVSPYVGIRYAQNNMSGYTEGTSSTVQSPLTYQNLNTSATTAIAGIGASHKLTPKTVLFGSVGMEQDLKTNYNSYSASGINGLTPVTFNSSPVNTRATANLGVSHELEKNQWISINGTYRQAPYQSLNSNSVMVYYTIGL